MGVLKKSTCIFSISFVVLMLTFMKMFHSCFIELVLAVSFGSLSLKVETDCRTLLRCATKLLASYWMVFLAFREMVSSDEAQPILAEPSQNAKVTD